MALGLADVQPATANRDHIMACNGCSGRYESTQTTQLAYSVAFSDFDVEDQDDSSTLKMTVPANQEPTEQVVLYQTEGNRTRVDCRLGIAEREQQQGAEDTVQKLPKKPESEGSKE